MTDITIVTAFFDIGRENFTEIPRSKQKYFEYFRRWARIKNDLVFVCENQLFADEVLKIREEFGLKEKTHIILEKNVYDIDAKLYQQFLAIENSEEYKKFRVKNSTENYANYNYIVSLKWDSINKASKLPAVGNTLIWMDFGFEHGGEWFKDAESYNFEWEYDFGDKVNLFYREREEDRPIFEVCRTIHPDSMMGGIIVVPKKLANEFCQELNMCKHWLADIGLMDDDQLYLLMAARRRPDIIKTTKSDWFMPIAEYSNGKFEVKPKEIKKVSFIQKVKNKLYKIWKKINGKGRHKN